MALRRSAAEKRPRTAARVSRLHWREAQPADWQLAGEREDDFHRQVGHTKRELDALDFLQGNSREGVQRYTEDETWGRIALVDLLASKKPLADFIRQALINLLTEVAEPTFGPYQLILAPRSKRSISVTKDGEIAHFAQLEARKERKFELAVRNTADHFDLSEKAVWDALARDKERHPEFHRYRRRSKR